MKPFKYQKVNHSKYKYVVTEDCTVDSPYNLKLFSTHQGEYEHFDVHPWEVTLRKGYMWDGATCAPDLTCVMRSSAVHDCLYQMIDDKGLEGKVNTKMRCTADKVFLDVGVNDSTVGFVAGLYYVGVRLGYPLYKTLISLKG